MTSTLRTHSRLLVILIIFSGLMGSLAHAEQLCVDLAVGEDFLKAVKEQQEINEHEYPKSRIPPELSISIYYKKPGFIQVYPLTSDDPFWAQYREELSLALPATSQKTKTCVSIGKTLAKIDMIRINSVYLNKYGEEHYGAVSCENSDVSGPIAAAPQVRFSSTGCQVASKTAMDQFMTIERRLDVLEQTLAKLQFDLQGKKKKK